MTLGKTYEAKIILQTHKPLMKEDLALIGNLIKLATDKLELDRYHLESYVTCPECGYAKTRVNPTRKMKKEWKCRNCGATVLISNEETDK